MARSSFVLLYIIKEETDNQEEINTLIFYKDKSKHLSYFLHTVVGVYINTIKTAIDFNFDLYQAV